MFCKSFFLNQVLHGASLCFVLFCFRSLVCFCLFFVRSKVENNSSHCLKRGQISKTFFIFKLTARVIQFLIKNHNDEFLFDFRPFIEPLQKSSKLTQLNGTF